MKSVLVVNLQILLSDNFYRGCNPENSILSGAVNVTKVTKQNFDLGNMELLSKPTMGSKPPTFSSAAHILLLIFMICHLISLSKNRPI